MITATTATILLLILGVTIAFVAIKTPKGAMQTFLFICVAVCFLLLLTVAPVGVIDFTEECRGQVSALGIRVSECIQGSSQQ